MTLLLETSAFAGLMRHDLKLQTFLRFIPSSRRVILSTIPRGEVLYGLNRLPRGKRRTALERAAFDLFGRIECLGLPPETADRYAEIKRVADRAGVALDENDLWIAAFAHSLGATLVTSDRDFERLDLIHVSNWT